MISLVWMLVGAEALDTSYSLSEWQSWLSLVDWTLPKTSAVGSKICYYIDISQTCSAAAIGDLLGEEAISNLATWQPTPAKCTQLLDKQRIYAQSVANSVFGDAIASAATASVTNFELMAQSWVLRAGHYNLMHEWGDFVAALNGISDWTTVHCDGANILYDGATTPKPDFLANSDCNTLGIIYVPPVDCTNVGCPLYDAAKCCISDDTGGCCQAKIAVLQTACGGNIYCGYKDTCCHLNADSPCCKQRF